MAFPPGFTPLSEIYGGEDKVPPIESMPLVEPAARPVPMPTPTPTPTAEPVEFPPGFTPLSEIYGGAEYVPDISEFPTQGNLELAGKALVKGVQNIPAGIVELGGWLGDNLIEGVRDVAAPMSFGLLESDRDRRNRIMMETRVKPEADPVRFIRDNLTNPLVGAVDEARREYIGEPNPVGITQNIISGGAEYGPGAAIPIGGGPLRRAIEAVTSGAGAGLARWIGAPEWIGALLGALSPGATRTAAKHITSPVEILAGKELLERAGTQGRETIVEALAKPLPEGEMVSYAELADSPSAASFQTHMAGVPGEGANVIIGAKLDREAGRIKELRELSPTALTGVAPNVRGGEIQRLAREVVKGKWDEASDLYSGLSLKGSVPIAEQKKTIAKTVDKIFGNSALKMDSDTSAVVNKFLGLSKETVTEKPGLLGPVKTVIKKPEASFEELKQLRQDARQVLADLSFKNPKDRNLPVLNTIIEQVDSAIEKAAETGVFKKSDVEALNRARAQYRETATKYKDTIADTITRKGRSGGDSFKVSAEATPGKVVQNQENARQFMQAFGDKPELVAEARAAALDKITKTKTQASWAQEFDKERPMLQELFGKDLPKVEKVINSIKRENRVAELATKASGKRSFTTQGLTVAGRIASTGPRALFRLLGSKGGLGGAAGVGGVTGGVVGAIAGGALSASAAAYERAIERAIQRAMVDPVMLRRLAGKATDARFRMTLSGLAPYLAAEFSGSDKGPEAPPQSSSLESNQQQLSPRIERSSNSQDSYKTPSKPRLLDQDTTPSAKSKEKRVVSLSQLSDPIDRAIWEAEAMTDDSIELPAKPSAMDTLLQAVALQESSGNPNAVSSAGAIGLHQIMPATAREIANELGVKDYDLKDPETNTLFARHYLQKLLDMFGGDRELALAAYHSGPGRIRRLLKLTGGTKLSDIRGRLGPIGQKYAPGVLSKLRKIEGGGIVKA